MGPITTELIFSQIANLQLFESVGKKYECDCLKTDSISTAITLWKSEEFDEASSVAWEAFRVAIPNELRPIWTNSFTECKTLLASRIKRSKVAQNILRLCGQNEDEFISQLPFVGAIGELLSNSNEHHFFLDQLPHYFAGHWVCGWKGVLHEDKFVYPPSNFIVY